MKTLKTELKRTTTEMHAKKALIERSITESQLYQYLTADSGNFAGIYKDGSFLIGQDVGSEIDDDEKPVIRIECPGTANMSLDFYAEGWTEFIEESGKHKVVSDVAGCDAGDMLDIEDCIRLVCADPDCDVSGEIEDLRGEFLRSNYGE